MRKLLLLLTAVFFISCANDSEETEKRFEAEVKYFITENGDNNYMITFQVNVIENTADYILEAMVDKGVDITDTYYPAKYEVKTKTSYKNSQIFSILKNNQFAKYLYANLVIIDLENNDLLIYTHNLKLIISNVLDTNTFFDTIKITLSKD